MRIKKNFTLGCAFTIILFFSTVFGPVFTPRVSLAEISVESYCQLSVQSLQQGITEFQELIALAEQYSDDPDTLAQQEEIKKTEYDQAKEALYTSFGTTAKEYVNYMGKNSRAVNAYFEEHQDIKQQIDNLSAQINSLLAQYETLKHGEEPSEPEPPLP